MIGPATPVSMAPFVSVDVETTGLDPERDEIVEIGAVRVRGGQVVDEFDTLVSIDRTIPAAARLVHGISNAMLFGKPRIAEAMQKLLQFAGDAALVEHSSSAFDVLFLERAHGAPLDAPYISTCILSRRLFPHIPKHSLDACCQRFHIVNGRPHRALGDARATADLLICLLELCGTRYPRVEDLMKVASVEKTPAFPTSKPAARRWPARARGSRKSW